MDETKAPHVVIAIHAVMSGLWQGGGIKKNNQTPSAAGGYKFRGIDDVYAKLAPLLIEHRLLILPCTVLSRTAETVMSKTGNAMLSVSVTFRYKFISAVDGSVEYVEMVAEGMDSGDKATNKANSAAYKYMALETFCISTEGGMIDSETESHQIAAKPNLEWKPKPADVPKEPPPKEKQPAVTAPEWESMTRVATANDWADGYVNQFIKDRRNKGMSDWDIYQAGLEKFSVKNPNVRSEATA